MLSTLDRGTSYGRARSVRQSARALPPAIILGGGANALSVARSLDQLGADVYAINEGNAPVRFSRCCRWLDVRDEAPDSWARFLVGPESDHLRGAVLLACSDDAIELIARHREELEAKFLLDDSNPEAQRCMLDKRRTYFAARGAGVPTPRFWTAESGEQLVALSGSLVFPLLIKPHFTHLCEQRIGRKFLVAENFEELLHAHATLVAAGIETMLVEWIPGPDDRLCSYYTYLDRDGTPLFHFTKRIIRRFPPGMGNACYHVTDWNPEVRDLALRLFRSVGLRGLANVEFKRDERDGRLKLIECNARFTAANCLVARSGLDLAALVYNRLAGLPQPPLSAYARGMRLWDPIRDFQGFLELRRRGQLTSRQWIASILHRHTLPYFQWYDPVPSGVRITKALRESLRRGLERTAIRPRPKAVESR